VSLPTSRWLPVSKTKIVCTIGPASDNQPILERMILSGMSVARVNLSHGDLERHSLAIKNIRAASAVAGHPVAIWGDLPGHKIRVGRLAGNTARLQAGQGFVLKTKEIVGDARGVSLSFAGLPETVRPGDKVYLNDGFIQLRVMRVTGQEIQCQVVSGGDLCSHDGVNLPGIDLGTDAFTHRDRAHLAFAEEQGLDAISPSFIQDAADLVAVRHAAMEMSYAPYLLAKIERRSAVRNLATILEHADAVVVARGDLGIETPIAEIALLQKDIICRANKVGRPAITATHMLESMAHQRLPTRAEVADVTNAVLDGADCLALSAETALGCHPVESVAMMAKIAQATEAFLSQDRPKARKRGVTEGESIAQDQAVLAAKEIVRRQRPMAILLPTADGTLAQRLSRERLPAWIVAFCPSMAVCQALQFCYGVYPVHLTAGLENWDLVASDWLQHSGLDGALLLRCQ
jgi:pyruvate kinase